MDTAAEILEAAPLVEAARALKAIRTAASATVVDTETIQVLATTMAMEAVRVTMALARVADMGAVLTKEQILVNTLEIPHRTTINRILFFSSPLRRGVFFYDSRTDYTNCQTNALYSS